MISSQYLFRDRMNFFSRDSFACQDPRREGQGGEERRDQGGEGTFQKASFLIFCVMSCWMSTMEVNFSPAR
jgi:hypothetical protein